MNIKDFFLANHRIALQFSGGKDSSACLWLMEEYWPWIDVVWIDTGDAPPVQLEYIKHIASLVPSFKRIKSNSKAWRDFHGHPVDFMPAFQGFSDGPKVVSAADCCAENMWRPMLEFLRNGFYDGVIQGKKQSDQLKNELKNGDMINGVQYLMPVFDWSDAQVIEYLGPRLPDWYMDKSMPQSSSDCQSCSAYLHENRGLSCPSTKPTHDFMISSLRSQLDFLEQVQYRGNNG
jgi:phosphoadenosine phosphosulfate reductase